MSFASEPKFDGIKYFIENHEILVIKWKQDGLGSTHQQPNRHAHEHYCHEPVSDFLQAETNLRSRA